MLSKNILADRVGGFSAIIVGIAAIIEGIRLYPLRMSPIVGDHTMPVLLGGIMVVLGLLMLILKAETFKVEFPPKEMRRTIALSLASLLIYCLIIEYLGYVISTFIVLVFLFRLFGSYQWAKCTIMALITCIFLYLVFIFWLKMPFPIGMFNI